MRGDAAQHAVELGVAQRELGGESCRPAPPRAAVSAFEVRAGVAAASYRALADGDREMLRAGEIRTGMPEIAAYLALGTPAFHWRTEISGRPCAVLSNVEEVLSAPRREARPPVRERIGPARDRPVVRVDDAPGGPPKQAVPAAPSENIRWGKSCDECDFNIKNGLNCTIPARKRCGDGDLEKGAGFCVGRPTDHEGYCSGRCKESGDCPSGYSCSDLKTGVKVCTK